ncbi:hypothetical protein N7517_001423 [Penicillium concentricum]|uniref:Uncharacterized protein n=1 Tax=Penicillium concentricum TaxID=293559 RepID=A0A9W9SRW5_9EURO|nr:uncharacterized protein N7517_001423 [Penicillium concentricum]KAJ5383512.1 hypothetical protein N7517_001423 [Penicillium concentricum]
MEEAGKPQRHLMVAARAPRESQVLWEENQTCSEKTDLAMVSPLYNVDGAEGEGGTSHDQNQSAAELSRKQGRVASKFELIGRFPRIGGWHEPGNPTSVSKSW